MGMAAEPVVRWCEVTAVELHLIRKVSAVKSLSVGEKVQRLGWDKTVQVVHPSVSVILCTDFSSSDFAVALCEEAVDRFWSLSQMLFSSVQPIISVGSF